VAIARVADVKEPMGMPRTCLYICWPTRKYD
jgi:hypothetical protein